MQILKGLSIAKLDFSFLSAEHLQEVISFHYWNYIKIDLVSHLQTQTAFEVFLAISFPPPVAHQ